MNIASARRTWRGAVLAGLAVAGLVAPHAGEARARHVRPQARAEKAEASKTMGKESTRPSTSGKVGKAGEVAAAAASEKVMPPRKGGSLYAVVIGPGPGWKKGQPLRSGGNDGHYAYWKELQGRGLIESAGPVGKDTGFVLLRARNQKEANALIAADPAIRAGRFRAVARPYAETLGN